MKNKEKAQEKFKTAENCCQHNSDLMQNSWPHFTPRPSQSQPANLSGEIFLIFQCPGRIFCSCSCS